MKKILYFLLLIILIIISGFGFFHFNNQIENKDELIQTLSNDKTVLQANVQELNNELEVMKIEQSDSYLIYKMLKDELFTSKLTNSDKISFAIITNNEAICEDVDGSDKDFCYDILSGGCNKYEYPNREMCSEMNLLAKREISKEQIINLCNSKDVMEDDAAQSGCFSLFARMTDDINLCSEVCKNPINGFNCSAIFSNEIGEAERGYDMYTRSCRDRFINR